MSSIELFFDEYDVEEENTSEQAIVRRKLLDASSPLDLEEHIFVKNFRLSKEAFLNIFMDINNKLKPLKKQQSIPNIIKLAATLKFLAQGSYQLSVGNDFHIGMAQPTVSVVLKDVLSVLERYICSKWIQFNYSEEEKRRAKIYFYEKSSIPNVIGAIDGTHIKIIGPNKDLRHVYYNRKGFYSLNAMLMCDHLMCIRYINAKSPGSSHDANIWNMSPLKAKINEEYRSGRSDFRILGDGGYPLSPYLMTPYRNAEEGTVQAIFNKKHACGRNIIERTIGLLKSKFRCTLQARELHYIHEKATQIINVCAALHNICIKYRVENAEFVEESVNIVESIDFTTDSAGTSFNEGSRIRDSIASFM